MRATQKLGKVLHVAFRNVRRYKVNWIIMIAIVSGAFTMSFSLGYKAGLVEQMKRLARDVYAGDLTVVSKQAEVGSSPTPLHLGWEDMFVADPAVLSSASAVEGVVSISRRLSLMGTVYGEEESINEYLTVTGLDVKKEMDTLFANELKIDATALDNLSEHGHMLISEKTAQKLGLSVGDTIYVFLIDRYETTIPTAFTVCGTFAAIGFPGVLDSTAYVDYSSLLAAFPEDTPYATSANIFLERSLGARQKASVVQALSNAFKSQKVLSDGEAGSFLLGIMGIISAVTSVSNVILFLTIFLFAFSSLYISMNNRTKEIGIVKSMGFSLREVFFLLTSEGALLGFIPALIGGLSGLACTIVLSQVGVPAFNVAMQYMFAGDHLFFKNDIPGLLLVIFFMTFITFLGAVPPVLKVLKIKVVEALK